MSENTAKSTDGLKKRAIRTKLSAFEEKFCLEFIETLNASEAYRRSYSVENMSQKSVNDEASRVLNRPGVASRIASVQAEHVKDRKISLAWYYEQLLQLYYHARSGGQDGQARKSLELLGKYLGLHNLDPIESLTLDEIKERIAANQQKQQDILSAK